MRGFEYLEDVINESKIEIELDSLGKGFFEITVDGKSMGEQDNPGIVNQLREIEAKSSNKKVGDPDKLVEMAKKAGSIELFAPYNVLFKVMKKYVK